MKGLFYILLCYLLGELLSRLIGGFVPASVLGMLILFVALQSRAIRSKDVRSVAGALLNNMMLFFAPVSVGLMGAMAVISDNFWVIVIIIVVTTLMVIGTVGWMQQKIGGKGNG